MQTTESIVFLSQPFSVTGFHRTRKYERKLGEITPKQKRRLWRYV